MTIDMDVKEKVNTEVERPLFNFGGSSPPAAEEAHLAYADVELSTAVETSDFDVRTVAVVAGIILFKLSMLGLLLVSI